MIVQQHFGMMSVIINNWMTDVILLVSKKTTPYTVGSCLHLRQRARVNCYWKSCLKCQPCSPILALIYFSSISTVPSIPRRLLFMLRS